MGNVTWWDWVLGIGVVVTALAIWSLVSFEDAADPGAPLRRAEQVWAFILAGGLVFTLIAVRAKTYHRRTTG